MSIKVAYVLGRRLLTVIDVRRHPGRPREETEDLRGMGHRQEMKGKGWGAWVAQSVKRPTSARS